MKSKYLMLLIPLVMISCARKKTKQINTKKLQLIILTTGQKALVQISNQFAFTLFKKAGSNKTNENLLISPFSVSMALSMTMNGAAGTTRTGIIKTLGFENTETSAVNDYYKLMSQQLQSIDNQVVFNIANSIWYRNTLSVLPSFLSTNHNYYNTEVSALDFSSPSAVKTINNWVNAKTNKEIPTIIDNISPDQVMYLINAIYFKGLWSNKFNISNTKDKDFYKEDKKVIKCKMMIKDDYIFPIYSNDVFSAIEMAYGHCNFVMTVLLPRRGKTTSDVIGTLTADSWKTMTSRLTPKSVTLKMPRFKMTYETSFNSLLSAMGMADAFNSKVANFTGINSGGGFYMSGVKHKTMVNVDEEGTVAVASTIVEVSVLSNETPTKLIININKPFIFVISEKSTGAILFTGRIMDPTK